MSDKKILIVEDEGIEAIDLQHRLAGLGYPNTHIVFSGEDAIRDVEQTRPGLVLMDIRLSGEIDGIMAADKIRSCFDIPIIYITAYADENTLERAKITEPYGYIVKPFKEREIHISIEMALYKHEMEKRLRESEKWLATTLKSIGDAVIATDKDGLITFMNPIAERLTGWKLEEVSNRKLTEVFYIVNRDTHRPVDNPVTKVLVQGTIVGLANHTMLITKDGKEIPIDDSAAPIKDDKGNIIGVILVFRDITEREKAESRLNHLSSFPELNPAPIIEMNLVGRVSYLNPIAKQLFPNIQVIGNNHPFLTGWETLASTLPTSNTPHLTREIMVENSCYWQSVVYVSFNNSLRFYGRDITERKHAEEQIREQLYMLDLAPVVAWNMDDKIIFWNQGAENLYGISKKEAIGNLVHDLLRTVFPRSLYEIKEDLLRQGSWKGELKHKRRDGSEITIISQWSLYRDKDNKPVAIIQVNSDITAQKIAEENAAANQRLADVGQLTGTIAHEIRNPLATIGSSAFFLNRYLKDGDEKVKTHLGRITSNVEFASNIIESIRSQTKLKEPDLNPVNLKPVLVEAVSLSKVPESVKVETNYPAENITVNADKSQLLIAFPNIVRNAIEAMPHGGMLNIRVKSLGGRVELIFADTGVGIPPENMEKLFKYLFTTKVRGTGFGLPTTKRIIEAHGGTIGITSQVGAGTAVKIILPLPGIESENTAKSNE